ncbi:MAG: type IV pili methyl-accepting chemotaxis transducer N-terminal domain-containing protein [Betaproteobacteria bacterium]|nr:type IV pili methyl-accepting chemotaxis transducer N-terminal domain-containing protein [Betaproteobacteria bacterium]
MAFAFLLGAAVSSSPVANAKTAPQTQARGITPLTMAAISAGELRASTQRGARLYLESAKALRPVRTQSNLEKELKSIDAAIAVLRGYAPADAKQKRDYQKALATIEDLWAETKPVLTRAYEPARAQFVYDYSEQLYIYAAKLTFITEDALDSQAGYLVDVAGRLQSTSERIAKAAIHSLLSGKTSPLVDFATWKKEYLDGYRELTQSPLNDDYQRRNLELGRVMWALYDDIVGAATRGRDDQRILEISKCADGMWDIAKGSRASYVALMRRGEGVAMNASRRAL